MTLNIDYQDNISYRRIILVTSTMLLAVLSFFIFGVINLFIIDNDHIVFLDFAAAIFSLLALLYLEKYKNITLAAKLATANIMFFLLFFIYTLESAHFSLIWTLFLPIFATLANGKKIGLIFSVVFYSILFSIAYQNIGIWQNGEWLFQDWFRLVFASTILTIAMYMNESAQEESDNKLQTIRAREKEYIQTLREKSIKDELTNLYNRHYYNEMIPKLMNLAKRNNHYITFFILDIDYFKNYNDEYGHIKGDETLVKVASVIQKHIQRGDDFVFRLGGEEFAGIIISDNYEKTHDWVMKVCSIIEDLHIEHSASKISQYLTVSIGIATVSHTEKYTMDHLYGFADKALYKAKNDGRNRGELSLKCA
jgi:diguanylate cyclase (GGDEF)-like protein